MNKFALFLSATLMVGICITGCKEDLTEEELLKEQLTQMDSLQKRGGIIKYTIKLASTANTAMLKSAEAINLKGGVVTVYQNDSSYTVTTDSLGIAFFANLRIGTAIVNVKLPGHAEVDYVTDLTPASTPSESITSSTVRYASTIVPMFPLEGLGSATITGTVTGELDLTNKTPETIEGVKVTATVDATDSSFVKQYLGNESVTTGKIMKYALANASYSAYSDEFGKYTLNVPASITGLPIRINVDAFESEQKLYLENDPSTGKLNPSIYSVPVTFTEGYEPSAIPEIQQVYIVISEPNMPIGQTRKHAKLTFEVNEIGSITKVNVLEKGSYSVKPLICMEWKKGGVGANLDPVYNSETGEIEDVKIIDGGRGYQDTSLYAVYLLSQKKKAVYTAGVDEYGNITSLVTKDSGLGYYLYPTVKFLSVNSNAVEPQYSFSREWNGSVRILLEKYGYNYTMESNNPSLPESIKITQEKLFAFPNKNVTNNISLGTGYKN